MRLLAIGDIHGCATALEVLFAAVNLRAGDTVIALGDYINKGPETKATLDQLIQLFDKNILIPLFRVVQMSVLHKPAHRYKFKAPKPHISGKTLICGHTPQRDGKPLNIGHAICLDAAACEGQWLTCLDVLSGQVWQANQKRELRISRIEDYLKKAQTNLSK
jgi:hypothetical protein